MFLEGEVREVKFKFLDQVTIPLRINRYRRKPETFSATYGTRREPHSLSPGTTRTRSKECKYFPRQLKIPELIKSTAIQFNRWNVITHKCAISINKLNKCRQITF